MFYTSNKASKTKITNSNINYVTSITLKLITIIFLAHKPYLSL